jgi:hypothetical protein
MPRGRASSSLSSRTQSMVARPSIESRKLILETMFAIKEDFSKNEATKWAVQELKNRGLKRLFKLVASTAYERLVWSFYENLKYDCNRPDVVVSSIDDRDVEVTIADIAAALKCHDEPLEANEPWIVCPPCSLSRILSLTYVRGNMQTDTKMPPARQRFLQSFGSWTLSCRRMCVP